MRTRGTRARIGRRCPASSSSSRLILGLKTSSASAAPAPTSSARPGTPPRCRASGAASRGRRRRDRGAREVQGQVVAARAWSSSDELGLEVASRPGFASWAGDRPVERACRRVIVAFTADWNWFDRCLSSCAAKAFAIAAARGARCRRLDGDDVALAQRLHLDRAEECVAAHVEAVAGSVPPSATSGVWIKRAAVRTPLVRPFDSLITGRPTNASCRPRPRD